MFEKPSVLAAFEDQELLAARYPRCDTGELGWLPAVDVRETADEVVVLAALPGVTSDDVRVDVSCESLTLSGRRREPDGAGWLRRELIAGPFSRRLSLPARVRAGQAQASHKDGILELRLQKALTKDD
jgi:HSP20 family protein